MATIIASDDLLRGVREVVVVELAKQNHDIIRRLETLAASIDTLVSSCDGGTYSPPAVDSEYTTSDPHVTPEAKFANDAGNIANVIHEPKLVAQVSDELQAAAIRQQFQDSTSSMVGHALCKRIVRNGGFESIVSIIVSANAVIIGLELTWEVDPAQHADSHWHNAIRGYADNCFLSLYTLELVMRLWADGIACFQNRWVVLDAFLVIVGLVGVVLQRIGQTMHWVRSMFLFRLIRLFRLVKAVQLVGELKILWKLVNGLMSTGTTVVGTLLLVILVLYFFACLGVEVIGKNKSLQTMALNGKLAYKNAACKEPVDNGLEAALDAFSTLPNAILTLTQFLFMDSGAQVYGPLIKAQWWLYIYFTPLILILPIALMNLVTASIVESSIANARANREMQKLERKQKIEKMKPELDGFFNFLDKDGSGTISQSNLKARIAAKNLVIPKHLREYIQPERMLDLLEGLDNDGDNCVDRHEFVDGIVKLAITEVPIETQRILKLERLNRKRIEIVFHEICQIRKLLATNRKITAQMAPRRPHAPVAIHL